MTLRMRVFALFTVVMALTSQSLPAQHVDTLTDADLTLGGVNLGDRVIAVRRLLGAPSTTARRQLSYSGLTILLDAEARCEEFIVSSPKWATIRGLRVGDSVARVFQLYGANPSQQDSSFVLYERSTDDPNKNALGLMVRMRGRRITSIELGVVIDAS